MTPEVKERIEQIRHGNLPEGYKKTAVGISPDDWQEIQLSKVVDFLDDRRIPIKESERIQGKYPYYGASGVIDHVADYIFDGEYILLGEDGANIIERSTPLAFRVSGKCWINNHAHVLSPKDGYHIDYLTNYLESLSYAKYNSGTAQPKLNQDTCQKIPVVCGSYTEQVKIADILSAQDTIMELKEKLLAEKQRQKKYLMQQLLTGKKRLSGYNGEWQFVRASQLFKSVSDKKHDGTLEVLSATQDRGIIPRCQVDIDIKYAEESLTGYKKVEKGNFVISLRSFQGGIEYSEYTGIVSPAYTVLASTYPIEDNYYKQFFKSADYINRLNIAVYGIRDGKQISYDDFGRIKIPYPPLEEQRAIAAIFATADQEIELLRKYIEREKQKKKALMQLLLTGIVRVNA